MILYLHLIIYQTFIQSKPTQEQLHASVMTSTIKGLSAKINLSIMKKMI